jgi:hypothetical protein
MTRPATRDDLLIASAERFIALFELINELSPDQRDGDFASPHRDRNVRDVLAHLDAWHLLLLRWHEEGMGGGEPEIPAPGHSWSQLDELNVELRDRYQNSSLARVRRLVEESHDAVDLMISSHSDGELFTEGAYPWTGSSTLGEYAIECTSSHYDWAIAAIERGIGRPS